MDYRELRDSPTARALQDRVMPDNVKQFENALKGVGIDPDRDIEQLTFVSYRGAKKHAVQHRHRPGSVQAGGIPA